MFDCAGCGALIASEVCENCEREREERDVEFAALRNNPVQRALDHYHAGSVVGGRAVITEAHIDGVLGPGEVVIRVRFEVRHDGGTAAK